MEWGGLGSRQAWSPIPEVPGKDSRPQGGPGAEVGGPGRRRLTLVTKRLTFRLHLMNQHVLSDSAPQFARS